MDIKKRNNELERQFEMAMYKKNHKSNGLGY